MVNTYDNTILYNDYVLNEFIEKLKTYEDKYNVAMVYVSDHGESLGEKGLYLHGVPYILAPKEQTEIPLLAWISNQYAEANNIDKTCVKNRAKTGIFTHDNIFHSLLGLYGVKTTAKDKVLDVFSSCTK